MFFFNKFHKILHKNEVWFMVFNASFNTISVMVAASFIGGGNQRKPPTTQK
jgi:hypothetical protein